MRPILALLILLAVPALAQTQREIEARQIEAESAFISGEIWAISKSGFTPEASALRITDYAGQPRLTAGARLSGEPVMRWLRDPIGDPNPEGTAVVEIDSQDFGSFEIGRIRVYNSSTPAEFATLASSGLTARGLTLVHQVAPPSLAIQAQNAGNFVTIVGPASTSGYQMELPTANASGFLNNNGSGVLSWSAGNFVTLDTTQTITGAKTFTTNNVKLNAIALQIADSGGTVQHSLLAGPSTNRTQLLNSVGNVAQEWNSQNGQILMGVSAAPMDIIGSGAILFANKISGVWTNFARVQTGSNHTLTWPGSSASGVLTNDGAGNLSWGAGSGACGAAGLIQYSGGSGVFDCESALSYNEGTNVLTATTMEAINFNAIAGGGFSAADASGNIVATMSVQNVGYDRGLLTLTDDTATNSTIISELLVQSAQISAQRSASGLDGRFVIEEAGGGSDITILAPAIAAPYNLDLPNVNPANGTVTCGGGTHVSVLVLQDGWVMQVGCS